MITNWDLINLVGLVLNKEINGASFTQADFTTMINTQSIRLFNYKLGTRLNSRKFGKPEDYKPGTSDDELSPFFRKIDKVAVSGTIDMTAENPADIAYFIPNPFTARGFSKVTSGELGERLNNAITAPTLTDPIIVRSGNFKFDVYPSGILGATVAYYKFPTPALVLLTRNETTLRPEYDSVNSVETEWDDIDKIEICYMILRDAGMNLQRGDVEKYANELVKIPK